MPTNILLMPRIDGANTSFVVAQNAAWTDAILFGAPGSLGPFTLIGCILTVGSNVVTVPTAANVSPGMPILPIPGIPVGTFVGAVTSPTVITMLDFHGNPVLATSSNAFATLTVQPLPLDLTGINFIAGLKQPINNTQIFLTAQTADGTMINGGSNGTLSFNVPQAKMNSVPIGNYVLDILAQADGYLVNLLPIPATVTVNQGAANSLLFVG